MVTDQYVASCQERIALLIDLNRPQEAEQLALQLLAQYPHNAQAQRLLGLSQLRQQRTDDAIYTLQQAIAADPLSPTGYAWLAEAAIEAEDWPGAQRAIRESLYLAPEHAPFHGLLAFTYLGLIQPRSALKAARAGLALDPTDVQCLNVQGRALAALGHPQAGAAMLTTALAEDPADYTTHTNLGLTYLDARQYRQARHHFALALQQQPNDELARAGLLQAFKHKFWLYSLLSWLRQGLFRALEMVGFWQLSHGARSTVTRILFLLLALAICIKYPRETGVQSISNLALALLLSVALVVTILRFTFLTLLRFDQSARYLLSLREVAHINLFWLFSASAGLFAAIFTLPLTVMAVAIVSGFGVAIPLLGNSVLPKKEGWRWSWTWAVLITITGYWALPFEYGTNPHDTSLRLTCLACLTVCYGIVFEFYQPSK